MGEEGEEELRMRLVLGLCHRNQTDLSFRMPVLSLVTAFTKKKSQKPLTLEHCIFIQIHNDYPQLDAYQTEIYMGCMFI